MSSGQDMNVIDQRSSAELPAPIEEHHNPGPGIWLRNIAPHDSMRVGVDVPRPAGGIDGRDLHGTSRRLIRRPHRRRSATPAGEGAPRGPRGCRGPRSGRPERTLSGGPHRGMRGCRVIWWMGDQRWWPLHHRERRLWLIALVAFSAGDNRFLCGRFLVEVGGQWIRATDAEDWLASVIVVVAGVVVAQHPRLPQAEVGDLEVRVAVLERRASAQMAFGGQTSGSFSKNR